jgi:hypothetical protein
MNTRFVMIASAVVLGTTGIFLSFVAPESAAYLGWPTSGSIILQLMGALYLGFAMINWTAKGNLIGGIYGRPVALGNFIHFSIGATSLIKLATQQTPDLKMGLVILVYAIFALVFGYIFMNHPALKAKAQA